MIQCGFGEFYQLLRKALRADNAYPWGICDDIALSITYVSQYIPAIIPYSPTTATIDNNKAFSDACYMLDNHQQLLHATIAPIETPYPFIFIGNILRLSQHNNYYVYATIHNAIIVAHHGQCYIDSNESVSHITTLITNKQSVALSCQRDSLLHNMHALPKHDIVISDSDYKFLFTQYLKTCVPESAISSQGAGSNLSDND